MAHDSKLLREAYLEKVSKRLIRSKADLERALENDEISDDEAERKYPGFYDRIKSDALNDLADENTVDEEIKDNTHSQMYQALLDAYYTVNSLSRRPMADPTYTKTIIDGIRDILKKLRKQDPHLD